MSYTDLYFAVKLWAAGIALALFVLLLAFVAVVNAANSIRRAWRRRVRKEQSP